MRVIASNLDAMLVKGDGYYWVVLKKPPTERVINGWETYCLNDASSEYRGPDALASFERDQGKATWVHDRITTL